MSTLTLDERVIRRVGHSIEVQLAAAVLDDARTIVRDHAYRTGRLHDSLSVEAEGDEVRVISAAPYSRFVHDGTVDTEAVPFLRQAATRTASRAGMATLVERPF